SFATLDRSGPRFPRSRPWRHPVEIAGRRYLLAFTDEQTGVGRKVSPTPIRSATAFTATSARVEARMTAHAAQDSEQGRKTYNARAGIEGTVSEAVRGPNLRYARYRGLAKTHLQNVLSAMAINTRQVVNLAVTRGSTPIRLGGGSAFPALLRRGSVSSPA